MLLSLLISLTATSTAPIFGSLGRPANAWFLRQLTLQQPDLAETLHDGNGIKPYTVSTLLDDFGQPLQAGKVLQKGESCWLRVTSFEPGLSHVILKDISTKFPERLALYKMNFRLNGCTLDPAQHPWARQTSYKDLAQKAEFGPKSRLARLEFASPTAFRDNGADTPLPIPAQIFRSLWRRWNQYTPEPMQVHDIWPKFAEACIKISELTAVNSERWKFAEGTRGAATGFTGTVGFTLLPKRQCGEWAPYWEGSEQVLQSLSQFAFYCGVGHHTTVGMGQTRPL